ncbi:helix-turn-helix transcriptional regulator [Herbiconiux ginsengi]|uniref:Regulatory protein, luxR family n=1 Tax=Herbiconiux ginsengi TaxID=381665 RepID=A0A1H3PX58_9MICO|nr:LuxR family transcriptional regulator [Herbiconiux ginsengi]SDZ04979.1 regulatory protein, luxR family [Herbiconiux ginsengi]
MLPGPPSARSAAVITVREALSQGVGVFVVGDTGSGRTRFVQQVLATVSAETRERLWVGDDVQRLDDAQADRLARAVAAGKVLPLATSLAGHHLPADLERLCRDGLAQRIELPPLSAAEMLRMVEEALGAPLHPDSVPAFVPRRAGGDLVVLRESVLAARASGALVESGGSWRLTTPLRPSDGVRRLVHARLMPPPSMTPETALVLDILGLAPELRLDNCVGVASREASRDDVVAQLERLESDGVIDVLGTPGELRLRIRDAVVELVLPQTMGVLRRQRLTTALVDLLGEFEPAALGGGELAALAKYATPLGRPVDPAVLTRAAVAALQASRFELSFQLASAAARHGGDFDTQLVLAAAESRLGQARAALARLSALEEKARGRPDRIETLTRLTGDVRDQLGEPAFGWDLPSGAQVDAQRLDLSSVLRVDSTRANLEPVPDGEPPVPERLHELLGGEWHLQEAVLAALKGELTVAHEHLNASEAIFAGVNGGSRGLELRRLFTESLDGRLGESIDAALALADQAAAEGQAVDQAVATWLSGHLLLYSGRLADASRVLVTAATMMDRFGMHRTGHLSRAEAAIALAQLGAVEEASATLAPALDAPDDQFAFAATAHQASGWIHAASGRLDAAVESFLRAADAFDVLGHELIAVVPLVEAARAGAARRVLSRLDERAGVVQGLNGTTLIQHARVLASFEAYEAGAGKGDVPQGMADEFDAVGAAYVTASFHLNAAEAFSRAALLHGRSGHDRHAAASARCADQQLAICGVSTAPLLPSHSSTLLSQREQEIAALAVAGSSNREIAETLVLSVRTVETHLQRVYSKLGVRGRSELAAALPSGVMRGQPSSGTQ